MASGTVFDLAQSITLIEVIGTGSPESTETGFGLFASFGNSIRIGITGSGVGKAPSLAFSKHITSEDTNWLSWRLIKH